MNFKQIICHVKTFGRHYPDIDSLAKLVNIIFSGKLYEIKNKDCYCLNCDYYLFTDYDFKGSIKQMRNQWKMWWQDSDQGHKEYVE